MKSEPANEREPRREPKTVFACALSDECGCAFYCAADVVGKSMRNENDKNKNSVPPKY